MEDDARGGGGDDAGGWRAGGMAKKFQIRVYRLDAGLARVDGGIAGASAKADAWKSRQLVRIRQRGGESGSGGAKSGAATHINAGLHSW